MDGAGIDFRRLRLNDAVRLGSSRLKHGGVMHEFVCRSAQLTLIEQKIVSCVGWTAPKRLKIVDDLTAIRDGDGPGP